MSYYKEKMVKAETSFYRTNSNFRSAEKLPKNMNKTYNNGFTQKNDNKIKNFILFNDPIDQEYDYNNKLLNYSSMKLFNKNIFKARITKKDQALEEVNSFYSNFMKDKILSAKNLHVANDLNLYNKKNYFLTNIETKVNRNIETKINHKKLCSVDNFIQNKYNKNNNYKYKNIIKSQDFSTTNFLKSNISRYKSKDYRHFFDKISKGSKYLLTHDKSNQLIISNNNCMRKKFSLGNYLRFSNDISEVKTNTNTYINTKTNSKSNTAIDIKNKKNKIKDIRYNMIKTEAKIQKNYELYSVFKFNKIIDDNFKNEITSQEMELIEESAKSLIQRTKAKLRFKIINESVKDKLNVLKENNEIPYLIIKRVSIIVKNFKKYIFIYNESFRQYINFLYGVINKEYKELKNLDNINQKFERDIYEIKKRIKSLNDNKNKLTNMKILFLKIKLGVLSLDKVPNSLLLKYGININKKNNNTVNNKKRNSYSQNQAQADKTRNIILDTPKKEDYIIKNRRSLSSKIKTLNFTSIYQKMCKLGINSPNRVTNKKRRRSIEMTKRFKKYITEKKPAKIFNSPQELIKRFDELENRVKQKYIEYNNKYQENLILKIELNKIKENNYVSDIKLKNIKLKNKLNDEIKKLKNKYNELIKQKQKLLLSKKNNQMKYFNKTFTKGLNDKLNFNNNIINRKIKQILLKYDNIDNILEMGEVYEIIKNADYSNKLINFNGEIYTKGNFYLKILELFYTKLIDWKKKCLENPLISKRYLKIKNEREKEFEIYKLQQKKFEKKIQIYNRNCKIMARVNRVGIIPIKRDDPYGKKLQRDKENNKTVKKDTISNQIKEEEVYEKFIDYQ